MNLPTPLNRLMVAVHLLGLASLLTAVPAVIEGDVPAAWRIALAGGLFVVGDIALLHIRFGHDQHSFTLSETALVVGLVVLPSGWVQVVAPVAVALAHALARRSPQKIAFNAASFATAVLLARLVAGAAGHHPAGPGVAWLGLLAGAFVFYLWNTVSVSAAVAFSQGIGLRDVGRADALPSLIVWLGNTSVGMLLVALARSQPASLFVVPVLLAMLYLVYWSYLRAMHERDVWKLLQATSRELLLVEPAGVAGVVVDRTPALFRAEFVELLLVDSERATHATMFRWDGRGPVAEMVDSPLHADDPFWGRVLAEREAFEIDGRTAAGPQRRELASLGLVKCIVAPLVVHGRCLGSLRIGFRGDVRFGAREMQVFTTFANHVSAAVQYVNLFEAARHQALHDPLTGLANRTVVLERLRLAQCQGGAAGSHVAVLFLDLDRFKVVNDSLGHAAGDRLLVSVASRINRALRPGDTAARFGGDEFVVLCEDVDSGAEALAIADRIVSSLEAPFALHGEQVFLTASVGVAVAAAGNDDPMELLRDADAAMYQAKAKGPARREVFDDTMRQRAVARLGLESDLRRALERDELELWFQPNLSLADGRVAGVEALVRWNHPTRGLVGPSEFIPLAEETGLIVPLGGQVLRAACRQLAIWTAEMRPNTGFYMSVNLSPLQLLHPGLLEEVADALISSAVVPSSLCLEVTESALVDDVDAARHVLERLRSLGVRVALDDFGTGYSSLSYLHGLPVDVVKLDRSFVARLGPSPRDRAVVAGMVELAHALDLIVVAEGVENARQLADLEALGCDIVQGFHCCEPKPPAALQDVLDLRVADPGASSVVVMDWGDVRADSVA